MSKRISITLIFTVVIAIVALFAVTDVVAELTEPCATGENTADYECNDGEQTNYTVRIVKPFPTIAPCANSSGNCSTYSWEISPASLSHFNLIVERQFGDKIVDSTGLPLNSLLDCDGSGDPSQGADDYAQFLTWHCFLKFEFESANPSLTLRGEFAATPTDWFVKQSTTSDQGDYGITQGLALPCEKIDIIAKTALSFTAEDLLGNRYLIEIEKNQAGDILHIFRTKLPDGPRIEITNAGISWDEIQFRYPDPDNPGQWIVDNTVKFIPEDTVTKTGTTSTCGYWYRGVFYSWCN